MKIHCKGSWDRLSKTELDKTRTSSTIYQSAISFDSLLLDEMKMNTIVVDNHFDVAQIQVIHRETHFQLGLHAGRVWITKFGYYRAAARGVKIDLMIFLEAEWGTGPLRANTNLRINVNDIKHSERHKMSLGHFYGISMLILTFQSKCSGFINITQYVFVRNVMKSNF